MENNFRSQLPQTRLPSIFPTPNSSRFDFYEGRSNIWPGFSNPLSVEDFGSINAPFSSISALNPHAHRAFSRSMLNPSGNEMSQRSGTKRFLMFDESGNGTTVMLTSGPVRETFVVPKTRMPFDLKREEPRTDDFVPLSPLVENDEDIKHNSEDEMHEEDTEELNALLFSDTDDYYEDEEEASTGHSPTTEVTDDYVIDSGEEINSFARPIKRQKLSDGEALTTTSNCCNGKGCSNESYACSALEDDAESSCGDGNKKQIIQELGSVSRGKRSRKGEILEVVSVLRSIIPGSNGKDDPLSVIDEAVNYLKTLKVEAMDFGLDPL